MRLINQKDNFSTVSTLFYLLKNGSVDAAVHLYENNPEAYDINETHDEINMSDDSLYSCNLITLVLNNMRSHYDMNIIRQHPYYNQSSNKEQEKQQKSDTFIDFINQFYETHFNHYELPKEQTNMREKVLLYFYKKGVDISFNNYDNLLDAIQNSDCCSNFLSVVFEDMGWKNIETIQFNNLFEDQLSSPHKIPLLHCLNYYGFDQHDSLIQQMKAHGVDLNIKDSDGKSVIFYSNDQPSVHYFINENVDLFIDNQVNRNAMEIGQNIADNKTRHNVLKTIQDAIDKKDKPQNETDVLDQNFLVLLRNELINNVSNTHFKKFFKNKSKSKKRNYNDLINKTIEQEGQTLLQNTLNQIQNKRKNRQDIELSRHFYTYNKNIDNVLTNINFLLDEGANPFQVNWESDWAPDTWTGLIDLIQEQKSNSVYNNRVKLNNAIKTLDNHISFQIEDKKSHFSIQTNLDHFASSLDFLSQQFEKQLKKLDINVHRDFSNLLPSLFKSYQFFSTHQTTDDREQHTIMFNYYLNDHIQQHQKDFNNQSQKRLKQDQWHILNKPENRFFLVEYQNALNQIDNKEQKTMGQDNILEILRLSFDSDFEIENKNCNGPELDYFKNLVNNIMDHGAIDEKKLKTIESMVLNVRDGFSRIDRRQQSFYSNSMVQSQPDKDAANRELEELFKNIQKHKLKLNNPVNSNNSDKTNNKTLDDNDNIKTENSHDLNQINTKKKKIL